jgi:glycosyltransferase involved in cell wall biosynthesis
MIARALNVPIKIAAKIDRIDEAYFRETIAPLLDGPGVEFIGEINEHQKTQFLGEAQALLFPVDWPEPFGLAMIESMACGTPVLAFRCGSVPEIIEDGVTGAIVDTVDEAIAALPRVIALDRQTVRRAFRAAFLSHAHGEGPCRRLSFVTSVVARLRRGAGRRHASLDQRRRCQSSEALSAGVSLRFIFALSRSAAATKTT